MNTPINNRAIALIADMNGDTQSGKLDGVLAMRITMALLHKDQAALSALAAEITEAGWHCVVAGENPAAYKLAYDYICVAAQIAKV